MTAVRASTSTSFTPLPSSSTSHGSRSGVTVGPKKRLCLSDRILFAKARLNTVSQRKKLLFTETHEDRLAEITDLNDDENLMEAAKAGKDSKIKTLIAQGCSTSYVDVNERTALHWAAEYGYMRVVYTLVDAGWDVNVKDNRNQTPLHVACDHHNGNVAACMISHGCKIRTSDINGLTPLHRAIHTNLETISCMLCNLGADVNARSKTGWTPIHEATRVGNEYVVRKLLKDGANVNAIAEGKATPFLTAVFHFRISHRSSYTCLEPILSTLIDHGCQLSYSDGQWSPLMAAISVYNSRIAGKLIYHGCLLTESQGYGRSVLVDAFTKCDHYVVKMLIFAGYRVTPEEVEQCSKRIPTFSLSFLKLAFPGYDRNGRQEIEILKFLRTRAEQPFTLQELCRKSIRIGLNKASRDSSILGRIPLLPLPRTVKDFVSLREHASRFV
ncbi:putative ankyrin repeat protein RF_0381 [Mya arenaria]|uniref:putative ankyrin repeat protein RF_0381 n=1 Tax=Mya arenaria TaxID=6604 RepID=UPI0022E4E035|nr:putative ankyrin repeat protein RF_0381 [Mya arenaria]XP_052817855.1 putative ankyrin repeat protein RF_0381 [Mya arenaria]XP_052817856.1 putative ankyrin repeat protein RF_0381 [Mya arenaria]XP_052817857.1 putative ankyrin repeat protein RF_0381 [Mya arenaria]XP_052817858.1 putative ankyrin repeat protein RF_0381 [Mya arenaria]XP_052817859.1 putative ankyrin repeat protein RF_0381 [Mya arenaria]